MHKTLYAASGGGGAYVALMEAHSCMHMTTFLFLFEILERQQNDRPFCVPG